jgi:hypothetical protein
MTGQDQWSAVDSYIADLFLPPDPASRSRAGLQRSGWDARY